MPAEAVTPGLSAVVAHKVHAGINQGIIEHQAVGRVADKHAGIVHNISGNIAAVADLDFHTDAAVFEVVVHHDIFFESDVIPDRDAGHVGQVIVARHETVSLIEYLDAGWK